MSNTPSDRDSRYMPNRASPIRHPSLPLPNMAKTSIAAIRCRTQPQCRLMQSDPERTLNPELVPLLSCLTWRSVLRARASTARLWPVCDSTVARFDSLRLWHDTHSDRSGGDLSSRGHNNTTQLAESDRRAPTSATQSLPRVYDTAYLLATSCHGDLQRRFSLGRI